nr:MAG TPA: hypothetical protein [Caudoviricetes sp.]
MCTTGTPFDKRLLIAIELYRNRTCWFSSDMTIYVNLYHNPATVHVCQCK